jgi:hypothetical protein
MLAGCGDNNDSSASSTYSACNVSIDESVDKENRVISGRICEDVTLDASAPWTLKGTVNVGNGDQEITDDNLQKVINDGVTLTIEKDAEIKADSDGSLIVTRGSKIEAAGEKTAPIVFSSEDSNYDGSGEWGGIIIQGFAPQYSPGTSKACHEGGNCNVQGEGGENVAYFGGDDEKDYSGTLKYVVIAEGGYQASEGNEINGLTLQGVGSETNLEYIQVHGNLDDGIEWFGGTANLKYAVLTNNDDDDLDFDEGYKGSIQYALIIKNQNKDYPTGSNDPRGIEANSSDEDSVKVTQAYLSNISIIGSDLVRSEPSSGAGEKNLSEQSGTRFRGDVKVNLYNSLSVNYHNCLRVDNGKDEDTQVTFKNILIGKCESKGIKLSNIDQPASYDTEVTKLEDANVVFTDTLALAGDAAKLTIKTVVEGDLEQTDYIGAIDPNEDEAWWEGWTIEGSTDLKSDLKAVQ